MIDDGTNVMGGARSPDDEGGPLGDCRPYNYYRSAVLVLLSERQGHGYELATRLAEMGFVTQASGTLYSLLRKMERQSLIKSFWDMRRTGGPPRRVYGIASEGRQFLLSSAPILERQHAALGGLLERFAAIHRLVDEDHHGFV